MSIFTEDIQSANEVTIYGKVPVSKFSKKIEADTQLNSAKIALDFSQEINTNIFADFERGGVDQMCHVSTFIATDDMVYMTYYANTQNPQENPHFQEARFAYCPKEHPENMTIVDIQSAGESLDGRKVVCVYDTIMMRREDVPDDIYIMWTADIDGNYHRLYRVFNIKSEKLGPVLVNRFKVKNTVNDFSSSGMQNAMRAENIGYKEFFVDIGIMQKMSSRVEDGVRYYYSGTYSGNFTAIIKSKDLITWEYVAQPNEGANGTGFENETKWENAVYVKDNKVYYFVRQWDPVYDEQGVLTEGSPYGILTYYDLLTNEWETPVLVADCQSRSDFIEYNGNLFMFYAPTDREHIGILKIDTDAIENTEVVLQADIKGSCFYPFIEYFYDNELAMSYTVDRKHIRLSYFTASKYLR